MTHTFSSFVVLAEMRTGSNFLEANLNALDGVNCRGEAFNPAFIGYPNSEDILGIDQVQRDKNPKRLLAALRDDPEGLSGFRYFHDHDPRVLDMILEDERCAKIILTRNPLDSYVSWKIAQATGQWKLTNIKARKSEKAVFDAAEFAAHVTALQEFQVAVLNRLQTSGQTAFYVAYEDLQSLEVMNGLAQWLGVSSRLEALDSKLKPQNPEPISAKVANPEDMEAALAGMDRFNMTRTPNFEPRRGPAVPGYVAADSLPLLFQPVDGGLTARVLDWMAALDGVSVDALQTKLNQKELRQWKRAHVGFCSFAVVRHPVARAHAMFCERVLLGDPKSLRQIRQAMQGQFKLKLPKFDNGVTPPKGYDRSAHREVFLKFLAFVKANLAGQTSVRVDSAWASQREILNGFTELAAPDHILHEAELTEDLPDLARRVMRRLGQGEGSVPQVGGTPDDVPYALCDIYDTEIESLCRSIYQRDYVTFGFGDWRPN